MADDALVVTERLALCERLGIVAEPPSEDFLASLQRAWVLMQPFHNIDLLAAWFLDGQPLAPEEAIQRCIAGLGGPCHVQSVTFLRLAQSLGFEASLCGATITHPDDHLLVRADVGGRTFYCDVGNGHPYLMPFPADRAQRQEHVGWVVLSTPLGGGIVVDRTSPDQPALRRVYQVAPTPRRWSDFGPTIDRHHTEPGFGPFLTGLRVVRIGERSMVTLRDDVCTRYSPDGFARSFVHPSTLRTFLADELGLGALPVEAAVRAWCSTRVGA